MATDLAVVEPVGTGLPIAPDFDLMAAVLGGRNAKTARSYQSDYRDWALFAGISSPTEAIEYLIGCRHGEANRIVAAWRSDMMVRGLASATINRRLAAIRTAVTIARRLGLVAWSLDVESAKGGERYRDTAGPGVDGVKAILAVAEREASQGLARGFRDSALVHCLFDLGLRRGEAVSLDRSDVDLDASTVSVIGTGRTEAAKLTLPGATRRALAAWLKIRGENLQPSDPVFVRLDHASDDAEPGRLTGSGVWVIVARLAKDAGITGPVRPHGLRHSAVTAALDMTNGDVRRVQKFSRHAKLDTLMIYDDNRRDDAGAIAELISGG
jgi:integrase/recombinase XerC